jgi:mannose-6-phosphate isomerase-like protein (cupin superfamily)
MARRASTCDPGPGPHSHEENVELFYVIEGTMSFLAMAAIVDCFG